MAYKGHSYLAVVLLIAASGSGVPSFSAAQEPNPLTCEGYPEQRVFLESQGWWKDSTVADPEGRHVHLGTCFPLHQTVRGILHFDVRIMLHNMANWGAVKLLRVQIHNNGSSSQFTTSLALDLACATDDCAWWQSIDVDTTRVLYDGRWEFRMTANIPQTAQGHRMYQTTRWHAILANGKTVKDGTSVKRSPGAGGWYTGTSYTNVFCGYNGSGYEFVTKEHSGVVELTCEFDRETAFASIDPSFHAEPPDPGMVLLDSPVGGIHTISIDTTTLTSGAHKLFLRTDATGTNPPGTSSGALVLPFTVQAPGPDITVTPAIHDYGNVAVDSSRSQTFVVKNEGTEDLTVTDTSLAGTDPTEFTIDSGGGSYTLAPGTSQDVMVSFNPSSEGPKSATLGIASDDPDEPTVNIALSGNGVIPTPDITVTPASHDYGSVAVGLTKSKTFVVSNTGTADLNVAAPMLTGMDPGEFNIDSGGISFFLTPGASQDVVVSFNPISEGLKSVAVEIASDDPDEPTVNIALSGNGLITTPDITVTPTSHDYGNVSLGSPATKSFEVKNDGTADLMITATTLTDADAGQFSITSGAAPPSFTLTLGQSRNIVVSFDPSSEGLKKATLVIDSDDPDEDPVNVALIGTGVTAPPPAANIAHEETRTGGSSSSISVTTSTALSGVSGHLYLAAIASKAPRAVTGVSGLGLTWTKVDSQCSGRNQTGVEVWRALGSASGGTVTATFASAPSNAVIAVSRYSGVDAGSPIGNVVSGNTKGVDGICTGGTDSNAYSFNLTTTGNGSVAYGAAAMRSKTHTPGAGYTERAEIIQGNAASVAVENRTVASASTVAVNGSFSGAVDWAMVGLEIVPQ